MPGARCSSRNVPRGSRCSRSGAVERAAPGRRERLDADRVRRHRGPAVVDDGSFDRAAGLEAQGHAASLHHRRDLARGGLRPFPRPARPQPMPTWSWKTPSSPARASAGWSSHATTRALVGLPSGSSTTPSMGAAARSLTRTTSSTWSSRAPSTARGSGILAMPRRRATSPRAGRWGCGSRPRRRRGRHDPRTPSTESTACRPPDGPLGVHDDAPNGACGREDERDLRGVPAVPARARRWSRDTVGIVIGDHTQPPGPHVGEGEGPGAVGPRVAVDRVGGGLGDTRRTMAPFTAFPSVSRMWPMISGVRSSTGASGSTATQPCGGDGRRRTGRLPREHGDHRAERHEEVPRGRRGAAWTGRAPSPRSSPLAELVAELLPALEPGQLRRCSRAPSAPRTRLLGAVRSRESGTAVGSTP